MASLFLVFGLSNAACLVVLSGYMRGWSAPTGVESRFKLRVAPGGERGGEQYLLVVSFVLLCLVMFCPLSFLKYDSLGGIEWNLLSTEWVAVKGFF